MVTIERRVHRLLRYRKFWFPSRGQAKEISESLRPDDVVRFFAVSPALQSPPHLVEHYKIDTLWIDLSAGPEAVLNGMQRKSCRHEIQRAEKMLARVAIEIGSEKADRDFLIVYNEFSRAKGLPGLRSRWIRDNSAHQETLVLYLDGQPLCSHLLLRDQETGIVRLLYSGSRRLESREQSVACGALNRYLHWHEIQRYYAQGFLTFDFGGLGRPESISRFKLSFGGAVHSQHFYLLSGMRWVAKLGKLVYEQILQRRVFKPADTVWDENSEEAAHFA
jgi:Acetyltransferase (GNAT) domain